ncbi:MAG TPA: hypothetical protein PLJ21_06410 [Pseudobdellovibrionaceae bacterium]|nr:hypothetical protein [Pseudobdellovibrionaceae bacterium]
MSLKNNSSTKSIRSSLVAEQPGRRVFLLGFIFSLIIGLGFRALINPINVRNFLDEKLKKANPNLNIQYSQIQISLKEGVFPKFQLKIKELKVISEDVCLMKPELSIDELRVPLSFFAPFRRRPLFESLDVNGLKIYFNEKYQDCANKNSSSPNPVVNQIRPESLPLSSSSLNSLIKEGVINNIQVDRLEVFHSIYMENPMEFTDIKIKKMTEIDKNEYELSAKSHLFREDSLGGYLSFGNLVLKYQESQQSVLDVHFFGNLREGYYSIISSCQFLDSQCKVESHFKEIPVRSLASLLNLNYLNSMDFNFKQLWLSFKLKSTVDLKKIQETHVDFRDIALDADWGRLFVNQFQIDSLVPLSWKPFTLNARDLEIKKLILNLNLKSKFILDHFENLGRLNGSAQIQSLQKFNLLGQLSGLSFVFSNKGIRKTQNIVNMNMDLKYEYPKWNFELNHILLEDGFLQGNLKSNGDLKNDWFRLNANINELILAKTVQELLTNNGSLSPSYLDLEMQYQHGKIYDLKSHFQVSSVELEDLDIKKLDIFSEGSGDILRFKFAAEEMRLPSESRAMVFLSPLATNLDVNEMKLKKIKGDFLLKNSKDLQWKQIIAWERKNNLLKSSGGWNSNGEIQGVLESIASGKSSVWKITGTRSDPQLILKP